MSASGNSTFDALVLASEGQRQADIAAAKAAWVNPGPVATQTLTALSRLSDINHARRCYAAALANNVSPAPFVTALQALGVSLYP
jgi:hypothetical protein